MLLSHVEETLSGLRVIYGYNAQERVYRKFRRLNTDFHQNQKRVYRQTYLASPLSEFLGVTSVMVVLVIGGTTSANTARLVEIARDAGAVAWRVGGVDDLAGKDFSGLDRLGLTAGASTPENVVRDVAAKMASLTVR